MKKHLLLLSLLANFALSSQNESRLNKINLTADDKHYLAGNFISSATGYSMYYLTNKPFLSCLAGFVTGATAGIVKEVVHDKMLKRGNYSVYDMTTTAWGSLAGAIVLRAEINIEQLHKKTHILFRNERVKNPIDLEKDLYTFK